MKRLFTLVLMGALCATGSDLTYLYWQVGEDNTLPFAYAQIVRIPSGATMVDKQPLMVVDPEGEELGTAVWADGFDPALGTLGLMTSPMWSEIDPEAGGYYLVELYGTAGQVAWSQMVTVEDLEEFLKTDVTDQILYPWLPLMVPEPSSALLLLLGTALIGLRRKR